MRFWFAALLASCSVAPDLVALPPNQGPVDLDAGAPPGNVGIKDAAALNRCPASTQPLLLVDGAGALSELPQDSLALTALAAPNCMRDGVLAAALDQQGVIWLSAADRSVWHTKPDYADCGLLELKASLTAMAFVYEPSNNLESLYVLDAESLKVLDTATLELSEIGPLAASFLVGTDYGELLALSELGSDLYSIDVVDLNTGKSTTRWRVKRPGTDELAGAVFWQGSPVLLFGTALYRYQTETDSLIPLVESKTVYTSLLASQCATGVK